ncbi:MAG: hypothetical protein E2P02_14210 [Acidobacteria bacterium]|nr:MAG: hypothetical protein E2P02_14210 [Acidobacteriota bacterium]
MDIESLIQMKHTQRAKDYPAVAELARLLSKERELELTTDVDRIITLASRVGTRPEREAVQAALSGKSREDVVIALAREVDQLQQADRKRLRNYQRAARTYFEKFRESKLAELPLPEAHAKCCDLAHAHLPQRIDVVESDDADAQ